MTEDDDVDRKPLDGYKFWIACVLLFIATAVGIPTAVILSQRQGESDELIRTRHPTMAPSQFPTAVPWEQLGQDLNGKGREDYAGWSVSLPKDASVVAVGAPECNFCFSVSPGYVVVYRLGASSQSWTQMGQELVGQANGDAFGGSVSLNGVGSIIAIGSNEYDGVAVQVLEFNSGTSQWELLGDPIERRGDELALSESGLVLAVTRTASSVRLFQFNRNAQAWQKLGQTLVGQAAKDRFGVSVALSSSGMIVGIGANGGGSNYQGQASVFQYNSGSSTWIPMRDPINGQSLFDGFGFSVSLDDSGLILAAGAHSRSAIGGTGSGSVDVFEFDNSTSSWTRRGQTLVGQASRHVFGHSVSLSRDGNVLAAESIWNDVDGNVRIFEYDTTNTREWIQVGSDIQGQGANDGSGWSVSLSGDGTVVVIGSPWNDNGVVGSGYAMVFTLN